ncbi:MAG TPA: DUF5074 domain-containing protein, partial [Luteibaculaceae bacterium]|nr:DUF5074 domain-containing protein [Luteibaculaceae bacterium]
MKKNLIKPLALSLATVLWFSSCEKDPVAPAVTVNSGVIVANEGQFQKNQAALSYIDINGNKITNDVYALANQEEMGDILQSLYLMGDTLFAVINNSQKIIALNARTFAKIGV